MLEAGRVVWSLGGHDKGRLYLVVRVAEDGCYIADGKRRPLGNPKRKNPRHLLATHLEIPPHHLTSDRALRRRLAQLSQETGPAPTREESC